MVGQDNGIEYYSCKVMPTPKSISGWVGKIFSKFSDFAGTGIL